jgi:alpha,alpha-trehalase
LSLVLTAFVEHGSVIYEKYDGVRRASNTSVSQKFGYTTNVVGFGWTNGVVLELLADLPRVPLSGVGVGH